MDEAAARLRCRSTLCRNLSTRFPAVSSNWKSRREAIKRENDKGKLETAQ